jgi:DNA-directed RNA polymerase alpha subunit
MQGIEYKNWGVVKIPVFVFVPCILFLLSFIGASPKKTPLPSARYKLDFFTKENQFYLCDSAFTGETGDTSFWTSKAYDDRMATAKDKDIVGVTIESFGHVKAELSILDAPSKEKDFKKYDHVVEAGMRVSSGILEVLDYPDHKIQLKAIVTPGYYRIRVYSYELANIDAEADEGTDHYKIEMWTSSNFQRKVLKQFVKE